MPKLLNYIPQIHINKVVLYLTYSDILMLSGWGLVSPILAVFITDYIPGADVEVAGLAATIYFLVKSIAQIPVAKMIDGRNGEKDDYWTMIAGSLLITVAAFMYLWATEVWHIYAIQVIYGLGGALSYPSWQAIFTRHIDKHQEAMEWSVYYTAIDIGSALTAGLGGLIAGQFGYHALFISVGVLSLFGTFFLAGIVHNLRRR